MHVYLVQHGKAKTTEEDPTRGLSDEGREDLEHIANFLAGLRLTISLIHHSGKRRAEETAQMLAASVRCTAGPCHTTGLNPTDDPSEIANFLKVYTDDVLIVGHLPNLERLTSLLLMGNPDRRPIQFRHGGVVCLEKEQNGIWSVVWAVVPDLLRAQTRLAA